MIFCIYETYMPTPISTYVKILKRMKNRLFTSWTNKQGVDCKLIGPESECFCSHRFLILWFKSFNLLWFHILKITFLSLPDTNNM